MLVKKSNAAAEKRVDPRVKRTRELIVRAFDELVAEKGHTGLTVQEIAERATINRATFYAHFRDQYELFDHLVSEAFREELRRRLPPWAGFDKEILKVLILAVYDYIEGLNTACKRTDRQFRPLIEARVQSELYELLLEWIEASPLSGNRSVAPEVTASVVSWAIFGIAVEPQRRHPLGGRGRRSSPLGNRRETTALAPFPLFTGLPRRIERVENEFPRRATSPTLIE